MIQAIAQFGDAWLGDILAFTKYDQIRHQNTKLAEENAWREAEFTLYA